MRELSLYFTAESSVYERQHKSVQEGLPVSKEPVIETERLILRPITADDAEAVFSWNSDERVTKYMAYSTYSDISQTRDWISSTLVDEKEWNWVFVLKEENKVIGAGSIGPDGQGKDYWGIGYNLHYDYWHRGYCTEAMKAVIEFAHRELGVKKICSDHATDNPRSGKVMEKCGLKFDHDGEFTKIDGSQTFRAKFYTMELE